MARTLRWIVEAARATTGSDRATCYVTSGLGDVTAVETTEEDPDRRGYILASVGRHREELPVWRLQASRPEPLLAVEDATALDGIPGAILSRMALGAFIAVRLQYESVELGVPAVELGSLFCSFAEPRPIGEAVRADVVALARLGAMAVANQHLYAQALSGLSEAERRSDELRVSEARLRAILESSLDAVVVATDLGIVEAFNPAAERMFGMSADEACGRLVSELMIPPGTRAMHEAALGRLRAGEDPRIMDRIIEIDAWRAASGPFPVELTLTSIETLDGPRFVAHIRDITERRDAERRLDRDAREQAALARVATQVAEGESAGTVLELIAAEARDLLGAEVCAVARVAGELVTLKAIDPADDPRRGRVFPVAEAGITAAAAEGRAMRRDLRRPADQEGGPEALERGGAFSLAVPVRVQAQVWGVIVMTRGEVAGAFSDEEESRLARFADLASVAIEAAEARSQLEALARTDALTGLVNHRAFRARLDADVRDARASASPLVLAILDVDDFKHLNQALGHPAGDALLAQIAEALRRVAGGRGLLARFGGDEFAWLVWGATAGDVLPAVEGMIAAVQSIEAPLGRLSVSAGVCDTADATSTEALVQLADGALYWAKQAGSGRAVQYSPDIVRDLSASERVARLERTQALTALRALARAVDAKDHSTAEHSERVAEMAVALAVAMGWETEACRRLREAALVHDVGKIGVPDAILLKPDRLTDEEYARVKTHATLGAEIVDEVLDAEQVGWVRHHHERWDGHGYPAGSAGAGIPLGSRLIAVADAWDVMRSVRTYSRPRSREDALAECLRVSGTQFDPAVVDALVRVLAGSPPHGA